MRVDLVTIYWRDIPAQVLVKRGRQRASDKLSLRFHEAIDRAAMRAKKIDMDAYLEDWRRESRSLEIEGEMDSLLQSTLEKLESEYDDARLDRLIKNKGRTPDNV